MSQVRAHERTECRLCGAGGLTEVLRLADTPPANAFADTAAAAAQLQRFALQVRQCRQCGHAQLGHVVDAQALFANYVYVSGTSPSFVAHFQSYADAARSVVKLVADDLVVEIGSNDGTLLKSFAAAGQRVVGVDPARDIAAAANAAGVTTINAFFDADTAARIRGSHGLARLVVANNVCAHVDELAGLIRAATDLLTEDGQIWIEVSYLLSVMEGTLFDTIYHEHLDYHRVAPLERFFAAHGLLLWDAERVPTHGGSLRLKVCRAGRAEVTARVAALKALERDAGLDEPAAWQQFAARIERAGAALHEQLDTFRQQGLRGAGYGAPAKATTLMYQFGLGPDVLEYIVDDSPWKQGLYSPGLAVPVLGSEHARAQPTDFMLVLAWNFAEPIINNNRWFSDRGGRFVVPLPALEVL